jgi:hypothetical protein
VLVVLPLATETLLDTEAFSLVLVAQVAQVVHTVVLVVAVATQRLLVLVAQIIMECLRQVKQQQILRQMDFQPLEQVVAVELAFN